MQNKKIIIGATQWDSQAHVGYRRFQIGCVFVEYDLLKTYTKLHIYEFSYKGIESLEQNQIFKPQ